jgi:hypothetical protein
MLLKSPEVGKKEKLEFNSQIDISAGFLGIFLFY